MQCAFIDLEIGFTELDKDQDRDVAKYCYKFSKVDETGVLGKFIAYMHVTEYEKQYQLPNPTVIESKDLSS